MTQMNTYKKSAPQVPVVRIGGGISVKYNHNNLLRIPLMLCLLCVGAAFFVSSCQTASIEEEMNIPFDGTTRADSAAVDSLPPGYIRIGDVIINTNWDGETHIEF